MPLKGEVGGHALNSHGNYIVDHGKSWKNHGIVVLNICGNPDFTISVGLSTVDRELNLYIIVVPLFRAAYAAPNIGTTILY